MKRFRSILLADGEPETNAALERAVTLAERNQAALTVVEVLETLPREMQMQITSTHPSDLMEIATRESSKRLENLIAPLKREGLRLDSKVLYGTPFVEIIREVLRSNHDLVMLTPRKKPKLREMLFGSRIMHLMRKCPCPVWAIKPTKRKKYARILAAVDPVSVDDERNALNAKIMELATSLAELEGSELHIVHCWLPPLEGTLRRRTEVGRTIVDKIVREARNSHKMLFNALLEKYALENLNHKVHLLKGDPGTLIPTLARKKRIELIVMGTVCRTGLAGFFIGNTAEEVLSQVDCSVLTVKPDGFVTPVRLGEIESDATVL